MHHHSMKKTYKPGMFPKDTFCVNSYKDRHHKLSELRSVDFGPAAIKAAKKEHTRKSRRYLNRQAQEDIS